MTQKKHTPGPWAIGRVENGASSQSTYIQARDGYLAEIAQVWGHNDDRDMQANARLIAAAPELYHALVMMLDSHDRTCKGEECQISGIDLARAAIRKARGEE